MSFGGAARGVDVHSPGGTQRVEWTGDGVFLTGWAEILFDAAWRAVSRAHDGRRSPGSAPWRRLRRANPARTARRLPGRPRRQLQRRPRGRAAADARRRDRPLPRRQAPRCGESAAIAPKSPLDTAARAAARAVSAAATACCADRRTVAGTRLASARGQTGPDLRDRRRHLADGLIGGHPRPHPALDGGAGCRLRACAAVERVAQRGAVVALADGLVRARQQIGRGRRNPRPHTRRRRRRGRRRWRPGPATVPCSGARRRRSAARATHSTPSQARQSGRRHRARVYRSALRSRRRDWSQR